MNRYSDPLAAFGARRDDPALTARLTRFAAPLSGDQRATLVSLLYAVDQAISQQVLDAAKADWEAALEQVPADGRRRVTPA